MPPVPTMPKDLERCQLLSMKEYAKLLGLSTRRIRSLYRSNKIPAPVSVGGGKLGIQAGIVIDYISSLSSGRQA